MSLKNRGFVEKYLISPIRALGPP